MQLADVVVQHRRVLRGELQIKGRVRGIRDPDLAGDVERSLSRLSADRVDHDLASGHVDQPSDVRHAHAERLELEGREVEPELPEHERLRPGAARGDRADDAPVHVGDEVRESRQRIEWQRIGEEVGLERTIEHARPRHAREREIDRRVHIETRERRAVIAHEIGVRDELLIRVLECGAQVGERRILVRRAHHAERAADRGRALRAGDLRA